MLDACSTHAWAETYPGGAELARIPRTFDISREPWPSGRPRKHQEFQGKQKNPARDEDLAR